MDGDADSSERTPVSLVTEWLASRDGLPTSVRAVVGYYADSGVFDYRSMRLQSVVDAEMETIIDAAFTDIAANLSEAFDRDEVDFDYETKLTLPAELTLGYVFREILSESPSGFDPIRGGPSRPFGLDWILGQDGTADPATLDPEKQALLERVEDARRITRLVVEALIDGDMRDALNDEEYEDFEVDFEPQDDSDRREIATIAQQTLEDDISGQFDAFPEAVRESYTRAVEISEAHQDDDEAFRSLIEGSIDREAIETEYKFADFEDEPDIFGADILDLPYFKTQYDRVGVIYDGMIDMYRGAGFAINDDFKRSIVLAIIGAQIWLDDISDYHDDLAEDQLTPVTAEYLLAERDAVAYDRIVEIAETYLDYAKRFATDSGTPLTGIAIEYIYRDGDPSTLPR